MQPSELAVLSFKVLLLSYAVILVFYLVALLFRLPKPGGLDVKNKPFLVKLVFAANIVGVVILAIGIIGLVAAFLWWLGISLLNIHTPGKLALVSLIFGISPLPFVVIASAVAKAIGGTLHEGGYQNCKIKSVDFGPLLYGMFMMGWATFFTAGIAVLGLVAAGIWKLIS